MYSREKSGQQYQAGFNADTANSRGRQTQFPIPKTSADSYSDDEEPQPGQSIPVQRILLFSRGVFEGSRVGNALFGDMAFRSSSGEPETRESIIGQKTTVITNMPLMVGQQSERDIVYTAKEYMGQTSYTAVVVVLKLPERATPETEAYYRIIRNIVGQTLFRNTILIFTNASSFKEDSRRFRKYLFDEILSSKKRGFPRDALGTLIKAVHSDKERQWETFNYDHCVLFDEKVQSTHDELLHRAEELNHPFTLADSRNGSTLKSNIMLVIIIILVGIVIKLGYENYTRAVTECEERLSKINEDYKTITLQLLTLEKEKNELNDTNIQLKDNINDLETKLEDEKQEHEKTKTNYQKDLNDRDNQIKTCKNELNDKQVIIQNAMKTLSGQAK